MEIRTTKPQNNKFYNTISNGGVSECIKGYPTSNDSDVLANCVGYACGRFNEIIGKMKYPYLNCNAEDFIDRAKSFYNLEISTVPTLGGIMVWRKGNTHNGNDGAGHVAIVEKIIDENTIYTSESGYGSAYFWNATRKNDNGNWSMNPSYTFIGCIKNPSVKEEIIKPSLKSLDEIAKDVIKGLYGNYPERKTKLEAEGYNYSLVQSKVNELLTPKKLTQEENYLLILVKRTIRGDYGNGKQRKLNLGNYYEEVQRQVNLNYMNKTTNWDNIKLY